MKWNWQQPDCPNFSWDLNRLAQAEQSFLIDGGRLIGIMSHLIASDRDAIVVETMSAEAVTTSEIEGEILDRLSVQSSLRRRLGLAFDERRVSPQEHGIAEVMIDLYRTSSTQLTDQMLFAWRRHIMAGSRHIADVGTYRTGDEPMQVVSGDIAKPNVHFEAPPSSRVAFEMARYTDWFNATGPGGPHPLPALTRAGIAHLYFESIHPFEEGNGRIGRAIAVKSLAQFLGQETLTSLSATILRHRKDYYAALEVASSGNEITDWLTWFAGVAIESGRRTIALAELLVDKTKLFDNLRGQLNDRQEKSLLRMFEEGPEGFRGGLSAGKYAALTGASPATTTRDLTDLVARGALTRTGEHKHTRYFLTVPLRPVNRVALDAHGRLLEVRGHATDAT